MHVHPPTSGDFRRHSASSAVPPSRRTRSQDGHFVEDTLHEIRQRRQSASNRMSGDEIDHLLHNIRRSRSQSADERIPPPPTVKPPPLPSIDPQAMPFGSAAEPRRRGRRHHRHRQKEQQGNDGLGPLQMNVVATFFYWVNPSNYFDLIYFCLAAMHQSLVPEGQAFYVAIFNNL